MKLVFISCTAPMSSFCRSCLAKMYSWIEWEKGVMSSEYKRVLSCGSNVPSGTRSEEIGS